MQGRVGDWLYETNPNWPCSNRFGPNTLSSMREFAFQPDRSAPDPLYRQLALYFEDLIDTGRLLPGERLPPTRDLAGALGLGRNTVSLTYETLEAAGRVTSHVGRGTFVAGGATSFPGGGAGTEQAERRADVRVSGRGRTFAWSGLFAQRTQGLIRLPPADQPMPEFEFNFRGGQIDPAALPQFEIQKAYVKALQKHLRPLSNHFDPLGYKPLRKEIARALVARGIRCTAGDVLVTNGAQQGLDLIARALVDPGDAVVVEHPGYFGAILAFRNAQAHLLGVAVDREGLCIDDLLRLARTRRIKLIYATPAVQMPTGVTLSDSRRRALLELADREQIPIVEDDYDGEFRVEGPIIPALKTTDPAGQVIYVGTLTKVLYPGLRLGYVVAARPLLDMLARLRFTANFQPSLIDQVAVAEYMLSGDFGRHVRRLRKRYAKKCDALLAALEASMPDGVHWRRPAAGATVWLNLPRAIDLPALRRRAEARGVTFYGGDLFGLAEPEPYGIGLMFSGLSTGQIRQGAAVLAEEIRKPGGEARTPAESPDSKSKRKNSRPRTRITQSRKRETES